VPQLSSGWQHNYSTKARQAGCADEQFMYSLMSMFVYWLMLSWPMAGTDPRRTERRYTLCCGAALG